MRPRDCARLPLLHDAERIPVRVSKNNVVSAFRIAPLDPPRTESHQSFDLGHLVVGIKIEVMALMIRCVRGHLRDRQLHARPFARHQDRPVSRRFTQRPVVTARRDLSTSLIFEFDGSAASTDEESLYYRGEDFWRGIVGLTF